MLRKCNALEATDLIDTDLVRPPRNAIKLTWSIQMQNAHRKDLIVKFRSDEIKLVLDILEPSIRVKRFSSYRIYNRKLKRYSVYSAFPLYVLFFLRWV